MRSMYRIMGLVRGSWTLLYSTESEQSAIDYAWSFEPKGLPDSIAELRIERVWIRKSEWGDERATPPSVAAAAAEQDAFEHYADGMFWNDRAPSEMFSLKEVRSIALACFRAGAVWERERE